MHYLSGMENNHKRASVMRLHNYVNPKYEWADAQSHKSGHGAKNRKASRELRRKMARKVRRYVNDPKNW